MEKIYKEEFKVYIPPLIAGWYKLGKGKTYVTKFSMNKKPNFIHRFFMRVMLGWYWEDNLN